MKNILTMALLVGLNFQVNKGTTSAEFQSMLVNISHARARSSRRLYGHQKLLLDISLNELASVKSPNENQHNMITQLDIRTGINEIIRIIQLRTGKIIAVKKRIELISTV